MTKSVQVVGAGAAGLVCAYEAAKRGREVVVVDHGPRPGRKLAITGGGRCNFSNLEVEAKHFLSANPHFVRSALARFTPWDAIAMVSDAGFTWEERELGQLFLLEPAVRLVDWLWERARRAGVRFEFGREPGIPSPKTLEEAAVVVATGGLSYPSTGASGWGHRVAQAFDLPVVAPRPALAPLTWSARDRELFGPLSGISLPVAASCPASPVFRDDLLFTHRGISGPAALQVSSYWKPGQLVTVDLLPARDLRAELIEARAQRPRAALRTVLTQRLPRRLVAALGLPERTLGELSNNRIEQVALRIHAWSPGPAGTGGYAAAEVTAGGVDTRALSSKTMEARTAPGLYFVGEVVDVTGWLGGYNLHWAWASGQAAGRAV